MSSLAVSLLSIGIAMLIVIVIAAILMLQDLRRLTPAQMDDLFPNRNQSDSRTPPGPQS